MSRSDIFPVLGDEMLDAYQAGVSEVERAEFEEWLGIARTATAGRPRSNAAGQDVGSVEAGAEDGLGAGRLKSAATRHAVSASLFWKHVNEADPDLPVPTREKLVDAQRMGLVKRSAPWDSYIEPLFIWWLPGYYNSDVSKTVRYRPIPGGHFGARDGIPVRELIVAFIWHWRHGTLPRTAIPRRKGGEKRITQEGCDQKLVN